MLNTRTGENYNANDVINSNDLRKRLLSIDSRFRTNFGDQTTNFAYRCEHTYRNVIRMRITSVEIPNTFYVFSAAKKNVSFVVSTDDITNTARHITVSIPNGNYTATELETLLQSEFNTKYRDAYGIFISVNYNTNTNKFTFIHEGLSALPLSSPPLPTDPAKAITFDFTTSEYYNEQNLNVGLGYNLGFRRRCYILTPTASTITLAAEAVVDVIGDTYIFLALNDLHTVEHRTSEKYIQPLAKILVRENKNKIIYNDGCNILSNEIIFGSAVDLSVLNIQLLDIYGNILDLNGAHFSFTVEITEVLNTKLYDFYRNYIWSGTIPSVDIKKIEGSGVALLRGRGP